MCHTSHLFPVATNRAAARVGASASPSAGRLGGSIAALPFTRARGMGDTPQQARPLESMPQVSAEISWKPRLDEIIGSRPSSSAGRGRHPDRLLPTPQRPPAVVSISPAAGSCNRPPAGPGRGTARSASPHPSRRPSPRQGSAVRPTLPTGRGRTAREESSPGHRPSHPGGWRSGSARRQVASILSRAGGWAARPSRRSFA